MTCFNQIQIMYFAKFIAPLTNIWVSCVKSNSYWNLKLIKLPSTLILAPAKIITLQVSLMKYLF